MIEVVGIVDRVYCDNQRLFSIGDKIVTYDGFSVTDRYCLLSLIRKFEKKFFGKIHIGVIRNGDNISFEIKKGNLGLKLKEASNPDQNLIDKELIDKELIDKELIDKELIDKELIDKELLDKANETIKLANQRIKELKFQLSEKDEYIENLHKINDELSTKNYSSDSAFSDVEILGFCEHPEMLILKKRYKSLSAIYHPDKGGSKAMMQRINEAYQRLRRK